MTLEAIATRHYRVLRRIKAAAVGVVRREWRKMPPRDFEQAYTQQVGPQVLAALILAQLAAADEADGYVERILTGTAGAPAAPAEGRLIPEGFAYTAADGRDLDSLLFLPVARAGIALRRGASLEQALSVGENLLSQIVATETVDAGRVADGVAIAARPGVAGYIRLLTPPSCARCVVLAGRWYRWNAGFARHP